MVNRGRRKPPGLTWAEHARFLMANVSRRGWGVFIVAGVVSLGRGWSYFGVAAPTATPAQLVFVERWLPLADYGVVWATAGLLAITTVILGQFRRCHRLAQRLVPHAVGWNVFLNGLWCLSFTVAQIQGLPRSYVSALSYLGLAVGIAIIGQLVEPPAQHGGRGGA